MRRSPTFIRGDEFLIGARALTKMYSPDLTVTCGGDQVKVSFAVYTNKTP